MLVQIKLELSKFLNNRFNTNLLISTHSQYILNHINLLIKRQDKNIDGAKISYDKLAVYEINDGKADSLLALNERLINTSILSETINEIYTEFNNL